MQPQSLFDRLIETIRKDLASLGEIHHPGRAFAISQLIPGLQKRYIGETALTSETDETRTRACIDSFLEVNARCEELNKTLRARITADSFVNLVSGETQLLLSELVGGNASSEFADPSVLAVHLKTGPGASAGVRHPFKTYLVKSHNFHCTASDGDVVQYHKKLVDTSRLGSLAERFRLMKFGGKDCFAVPKFVPVPKNYRTFRGIAAQPSKNMECQLAHHGWLSERGKKLGWFDLETQQEHNRLLAYLGSLGSVPTSQQIHCGVKTAWSFCTVDLKAASDYPSELPRILWPSDYVSHLELLRSKYVEVDDVVVEKHVFSTMGNGFTFVVMTSMFSAIVKTLYALNDLPEYDNLAVTRGGVTRIEKVKTWAVFGDDIIVDRSVYPALLRVLDTLGFTVNHDKTFAEGPFRESCGSDWYNGYQVRPVFVENLVTEQEVVSLLNRLSRWGSTHGVDLPLSTALLMGLSKHHLVPPYEADDAGVKVPLAVLKRLEFPDRNDLAKLEFYLTEDRDQFSKAGLYYTFHSPITNTVRIVSRKPGKLLEPNFFTPSQLKEFTRKRWVSLKDWVNPFGAYLAFLGGYIRNYSFSPPKGFGVKGEYTTRVRRSPGWGDDVRLWENSLGSPGQAYRLWEEWVERNLS